MYRVLARDLIASERPKGLDELELEEYTMLLEDKAFPTRTRPSIFLSPIPTW